MIILLEREGQMCNQLLSLASVYCLSREYNDKLLCPIIDIKLKQYFSFKNQYDSRISMYYSSEWYLLAMLIKVIKKIFPIKGTLKYNPGKKLHVFHTWQSYQDTKLFVKYIDEIRSYFKIESSIEDKCKKIISKIRCESDIIVGVHLRRGDYKTYKNGDFYYDDETVISWLKQLKKESKQNIHFLLCSNEKIDCEKYKKSGLSVSQPGKNSIEDLCLLSITDYILSPPSTYSFWAAMYGNKPRCILENSHSDISWDKFICFEKRVKNGETIR